MAFLVIRRAWPRGPRDQKTRPIHTMMVESGRTRHEAKDKAARLAAAYAYHRYDEGQSCWEAHSEEGPVFTFTVEGQPE